MRDGEFREDLFYRINVLPISIPPLRERKEDIPLLVNHFLGVFSRELGKSVDGFSADAMRRLMAHDWPGNVRELQNKIKQSIVTTPGSMVQPDDVWLDESTPEPTSVDRGRARPPPT